MGKLLTYRDVKARIALLGEGIHFEWLDCRLLKNAPITGPVTKKILVINIEIFYINISHAK